MSPTTPNDLTNPQPSAIIGALLGTPAGKPRSGAHTAGRIARRAEARGLTVGDVLQCAEAFLDGREDAATFRAGLLELAAERPCQEEPETAAEPAPEPVAEPVTEPEETAAAAETVAKTPVPPARRLRPARIDILLSLARNDGFTLADARTVLNDPNPKVLAIINGLARRHGGTPRAVPEGTGRGRTFRYYLSAPAADA
jgi:hypothetical protein